MHRVQSFRKLQIRIIHQFWLSYVRWKYCQLHAGNNLDPFSSVHSFRDLAFSVMPTQRMMLIEWCTWMSLPKQSNADNKYYSVCDMRWRHWNDDFPFNIIISGINKRTGHRTRNARQDKVSPIGWVVMPDKRKSSFSHQEGDERREPTEESRSSSWSWSKKKQKSLSNRNRTSDRQMTITITTTVCRSTNWAIESGLSSMGLEPTTLGLLDPRSNQLSYEDVGCWCLLKFTYLSDREKKHESLQSSASKTPSLNHTNREHRFKFISLTKKQHSQNQHQHHGCRRHCSHSCPTPAHQVRVRNK